MLRNGARKKETTPRKAGGGRKASETWQERYQRDPTGASKITFDLGHSLAARLEAQAKEEGTTVAKLLTHYAHENMFDKQVL